MKESIKSQRISENPKNKPERISKNPMEFFRKIPTESQRIPKKSRRIPIVTIN